MPTTGTIAGATWGPVAGKQQIVYDWTSDYTEQSDQDGTVITAVVQTAATTNTYQDFPAAMLGFNPGHISRILPEPHPWKNWLYCTRCELQTGIGYVAEGSGNKLIEYDATGVGAGGTGKLRWSVTWQDLGYKLASDAVTAGNELKRFVSRRSTGVTEALPMKGTSWRISPAGHKIPEPRTKLFTSIQLEYTWWWVPEPLKESTWLAALNKVNSGAFDTETPGANYPTETVLFTAYEKTDPVRDAQGNKCYHVTMHFNVKTSLDAAGNTLVWNTFWRANGVNGAGFYRVVDTATNTVPPFASTSLNALFT